MDDTTSSAPAPSPATVTRRQALQRVGVVAGAAGAVWAAPALTTMGSAFAAGSPAPGGLTVTTDGVGTRTYTNVSFTCVAGGVQFSATGKNAADNNLTTTVSGTFGTTVNSTFSYTFSREDGYNETGTGTITAVSGSTYSFTSGSSNGTFTNVPAC